MLAVLWHLCRRCTGSYLSGACGNDVIPCAECSKLGLIFSPSERRPREYHNVTVVGRDGSANVARKNGNAAICGERETGMEWFTGYRD